MTDSLAFRRFGAMSEPLTGRIPDSALFAKDGGKDAIPLKSIELEEMAPEVDGALGTSMPLKQVHKKGLPGWGERFISVLADVEGNTVAAAELIERDFSVVYRAWQDYPDLAKAVAEIKGRADKQNLDILEALSVEQAKDPANKVERIFQLNALNSPKYRPKGDASQVTAISITVGVSVPRAPTFSQEAEIPAAATVSEPTSEEP